MYDIVEKPVGEALTSHVSREDQKKMTVYLDCEGVIELLERAEYVALDTETSGEDIRDGRGYLVGLSVAYGNYLVTCPFDTSTSWMVQIQTSPMMKDTDSPKQLKTIRVGLFSITPSSI